MWKSPHDWWVQIDPVQRDECIRVRRDQVMYPSCIVPTVQACGGSVRIWGWISWSGLGWLSDYLNVLNEQQWFILDLHRVQTWTSRRIFGVCWRRRPVISTRWQKVNATLDRNAFFVTLYNLIKTMPWGMCPVISWRRANQIWECVALVLAGHADAVLHLVELCTTLFIERKVWNCRL